MVRIKDNPVKNAKRQAMEDRRSRGKQRLRCRDGVQTTMGLVEEDASDINELLATAYTRTKTQKGIRRRRKRLM